MPGAGFKKIAREWRALQETVVNRPYNMVQEQMVYFLLERLVIQRSLILLFSILEGKRHGEIMLRHGLHRRPDQWCS